MKIKLVISDLDQTILDTLNRFFRVFNKTLNFYCSMQVDWKTFLEKYKKDKLDNIVSSIAPLDKFWDKFLEIYDDESFTYDKVIDGVKEALSQLKNEGLKIIVVTGRKSRKERVWENLRYHRLDVYIDDVYTVLDVDNQEFRFSKKEIILKVLNDYSFKREEAVFVGDYRYDMLSGKKAGVLTIGVLTGHEDRKTLFEYGADLVIKSMAQLPKIIKDMERE